MAFRARTRPRRTVLGPRVLDRRLEGWRRDIARLGAPVLGVAADAGVRLHPIDWYTVVLESADFVDCRHRDELVGLVKIQKPHVMTGAVATRTVSAEVQFIVPPYTPGDIIYAVALAGGSGLGVDLGASNVEPYRLVDLNIDGRMWAEEAP